MAEHSEDLVSLPKPGEKVRIPKGAFIATTHPAGDRIAKRSQVVTVAHVVPRGLEGVPGVPWVSWAGSGGYWCSAWEWEPDLRHQCEGTRSTVDGEPFRCPIRLHEPGRRYCGRCSLAIELDGEDAVRWPSLPQEDDSNA